MMCVYGTGIWRSRCGGDAADLCPDAERSCPGDAMFGGDDNVSVTVKEIGDLVMDGDEVVGLAG
jgi:hypothetical protein